MGRVQNDRRRCCHTKRTPMLLASKLLKRRAVTSPKRSIAKTITWRIIAEVDTFTVSYLITGSMAWSLSIVGIESTTKTVLYYLHERAWGRIGWGTDARPSPPEIAAD